MKKILFLSMLLLGCGGSNPTNTEAVETDSVAVENETEWAPGDSIAQYDPSSFSYFVQHFPRKATKEVRYWNGEMKSDTSLGVLDIDVTQNQQCADAIIRLHAEWQYKNKKYADIHYNFTSGFTCDFEHWANGYRVRVNGNNVSWYRQYDTADYSYENFRSYLETVFLYAGTASLAQELKYDRNATRDGKIEVGDVFVIGGYPGHAVIVVDKIIHDGIAYYQFAQSWMPAQDIEIVRASNPNVPNYKDYTAINNDWCDGHFEVSGYRFIPQMHHRTWLR